MGELAGVGGCRIRQYPPFCPSLCGSSGTSPVLKPIHFTLRDSCKNIISHPSHQKLQHLIHFTFDTFYIRQILRFEASCKILISRLQSPKASTSSPCIILFQEHPCRLSVMQQCQFLYSFVTSQNLNCHIWIRIEQKLGVYFSKLSISGMDSHVVPMRDKRDSLDLCSE